MPDAKEEIKNEIKDLVGSKFYDSVEKLSDMCGELSGAYKIITQGESILTQLGFLQGPESDLEKVTTFLKNIQEKLDKILGEIEKDRMEQAHDISIITRTTIYNDASNVKTAAINANNTQLFPSADPQDDVKRQFIGSRVTAQESFNHFKDNPQYWKRPYLDLLDYEDIWSGPMQPETDGIEVWDFLVTLPAHLESLVSWSVIVLGSDSNFQKANFFESYEIITHIDKLQIALEEILRSFQIIRPPVDFEIPSVILAADNARFYPIFVVGNPEPWINHMLNTVVRGGRWRLSGYRCGMVEKYTGSACFEAYPISEMVKEGQHMVDMVLDEHGRVWDWNHFYYSDDPVFKDRFKLRHYLRSWAKGKELANSFGLINVRNSICHLCSMRNIQPRELPPEWYMYVVSSFREIWSIVLVPDSLRGTQDQRKPASMRELAGILGIQSPITMRKIFFLDEFWDQIVSVVGKT